MKLIKRIMLILIAVCVCGLPSFAKGVIVPTDKSQADFLNMYKYILNKSNSDYRLTSSTIDTNLFPKYSEDAIYWVKNGTNRGSFIVPEELYSSFSGVSSSTFDSYNWQSAEHYSVQYRSSSVAFAIFKSDLLKNGTSANWEALHFKNMFDSYLYNNIYYYTDEEAIKASDINGSTQVLIIPAFSLEGTNYKYYIDSIFKAYPEIKSRLNSFLARGGMIYAEGNAVYFIEKLGYLATGAVDFSNMKSPDPITNKLLVNFTNSSNPMAFTGSSTGDSLYSSDIPKVTLQSADIAATLKDDARPIAFALTGSSANNGKILCNLGLPTVGGINEIKLGSRQLAWTMNALIYGFAKNLDITRSIYNDVPDSLPVGKNAVSFDRIDTFEVRIKLRNLSTKAISGIELNEYLRSATVNGVYKPFFNFVGVQDASVSYTTTSTLVQFTGISIPANSEKVIVYYLSTTDPTDDVHSNVEKFISWADYVYESYGVFNYSDADGKQQIIRYRDYADVMISAKIVADADLNWKNILGTYYQPFKVFMIMENKERTSGVSTKYVQYIPKDVPFYWTDNSINIPILRTPCGKYVDVLRGSDDQNYPEFDMDGDGKPDAWLDTATIFPKGYTLEETTVYWLNPWEHLRSGDTTYYEDINHDGIRAMDTNGDGIVDIEAPGDKIRVWKVTWDIGTVKGYEYFDPYCSYEIWIDPPDLVALSAGVSKAYNKLDKDYTGSYYPYTLPGNNPNLSDTSWANWMERDNNGMVAWKQLINQSVNNYEGFTFIDTTKSKYKLSPTDECVGTAPQPHQEYIAVLSLGGEEIDMENYTPKKSLYSNLYYKTIFNEQRTTPIRTTYTYWAPLPNPMQFEYLDNCFLMKDSLGNQLKYLPKYGTANLTFNVDATTEYSYYWIRNAGYDVDYNDPSLALDGVDSLGDGVFGYMVYDIPKGMADYKITLPKNADGSYNIDSILKVDGLPYHKWIENPHTGNDVLVKEDQFQYHLFIPQLLIPPALCDHNGDGIDDWIDDRGDRFQSTTGFLHDNFMKDNGEDWYNYPTKPFLDDIYGTVNHGWFCGADSTYGNDFFSNLGKIKFTIHATYQGLGKEGPVDISKGGWLVVEEIFGGSPWVIFSHTLSAYAQGVKYNLSSSVSPSTIRQGIDTVYIKHVITDADEPHLFDSDFDPYHVSFGYGESAITSYAGGRDPCDLISPPLSTTTIIDPKGTQDTITLIPYADASNPSLSGYPKQAHGKFLEVRIEVMNGTDDNWINTTVTPVLSSDLGNTKVEMSYVSYPRPLVPQKVDPVTGAVIQGGDDPEAFRAGWRFNQPDGEVLIKIGNTLPLMQPSRRGYFVFLFNIDTSLAKGVYTINFNLSSTQKHYNEIVKNKYNDLLSKSVNYEVPPIQFAFANRTSSGSIIDYPKIVIDHGNLKDITVATTNFLTGNQDARWTTKDVNNTNFDSLKNKLSTKWNSDTKTETIDLSGFTNFPSTDLLNLYILEPGSTYSYNASDPVLLTSKESLHYSHASDNNLSVDNGVLRVTPLGPKLSNFKKVYSINGKVFKNNETFTWNANEKKDIVVLIQTTNQGNNIAEDAILNISPGKNFIPNSANLPANCTIKDNIIQAQIGSLIPGETKQLYVGFTEATAACAALYNDFSMIPTVNVTYNGNAVKSTTKGKEVFAYPDNNLLKFPAQDYAIQAISANKKEVGRGEAISLSAYVANNPIYQNGVKVNMLAVINHKDTVFVGTKTIDSINADGMTPVSFDWTVPDTARFIQAIAILDPDGAICEFCKNNNTYSSYIPMKGINWILDVQNSPNPVDYKTEFSYYLPREAHNLTITIYTITGIEVARIENCPDGIGYKTIEWFAPSTKSGPYTYKITGKNENNGDEIYNGKLIKR